MGLDDASGREGRIDGERWEALEPALPLVYVAMRGEGGGIRFMSDVVREWTGHAPDEFADNPGLWFECMHPGDAERIQQIEDRYQDSKDQLDLEYRLIGPDGEPRWVWERNTIVRDGHGNHLCTHGTVVDLSRFGAQALSEVTVDGHAALVLRHNFLTGLPTRHVLGEHLKLALARAERSGRCVILADIDMDRFRGVNDAVGHAAGDLVLMQVARRLHAIVDPGDLLVYSGGDEFLLLLSDIDPDGVDARVREVSGRMWQALEAPFEAAGQQLHLRASAGYAVAPEDGEDADTLHNAAHAAVTAAKAAGRGNLRRYKPDAAQNLRRMSVDYRLRNAIANQEIVPYYQPLVDLSTGAVFAVEALVRWQLADGEVLGAGEVVPAAEESSLIVDLDVHMLRTVCAQARRWREQRRNLQTHINISSRMVRWPGFARAVLQAIDEAAIQPRDIVLELTETSSLLDDSAIAGLLQLVESGVALALDDFGAGYASLERLRTLPISIVKLDRLLLLAATGELPESQRMGPASRTAVGGRTILGGLIAMGNILNLSNVVEGVETEHVRDLVVELGAKQAQGYFFGRPAPVEEFERALDQR